MKDPTTKRSRGFGFVTYSDESGIDNAQANRPHEINGRTVESKRAVPRNERNTGDSNQSVKKIFVGGLREGIEENDLMEFFSKFGKVSIYYQHFNKIRIYQYYSIY